ncbi:tRNA-splicing endonuclease subunit [Wickerhamomyces ciferrii]|uniref:tRNA-splicing endonuclease subunit n=1 Tax=Wickerhamomyces ciferrii (strain ATCC 14091 / BCRC 22168 / CBS 111 / JCM 3599 / NBRC 0793 / NRRL Y-1031 F-60-10) TaxID=1206466 RepID=K0KTZ0_WICCF|nr:tRNA-splicing endonuclease subunit [Wickerhamomyces ciferrii]CCH44864.1 tRNA-splicing endonuclease subunit [Wickerhamomyces ciferrii]
MSIPLVDQVQQNLLFQQLWTQVTPIKLSNITILQGFPKEKLISDDETNLNKEFVLPIKLKDEITPNMLDQVFKELQGVKRLVLGIVNDDGTVVYYIVHDGVYKPKKN